MKLKNTKAILMTSLVILLPMLPAMAQPVAVPHPQEITVTRPIASPISQEVVEQVNVLDLVMQSNEADYQPKEFVEKRRILRLSQSGL